MNKDTNHNQYKICSRCVMDTSDPQIVFDELGICNHCRNYLKSRERFNDSEHNQHNLDLIVEEIKSHGKGNQYDCIIGVSGGVDSTYVAYVVRKLGLRPLAVHLDNGWNSELAVSNIENVLAKLDIDLHTHVLPWEEFRDLQVSMLKASTPDSEIPTDHAIRSVLQQTARRYRIGYILNGRNYTTEGISPWAWTYSALDWRYIKNVHRRFGRQPLKTFPHFNLLQLGLSASIQRVKQISILNYFSFQKKDAMSVLTDELGWRDYGGKHYESIYTRFFQSYILPKKFNIDKRRSYLSVLVASKQMNREEALEELSKSTYPEELVEEDKAYVVKKLDITENEFTAIMEAPLRTFRDYHNNSRLLYLHNNKLTPKVIWAFKRLGVLPKNFANNLVPMEGAAKKRAE